MYYNEIESDIDSLKKQIKSMNNKVEHIEKIKQKVKGDLHFLGEFFFKIEKNMSRLYYKYKNTVVVKNNKFGDLNIKLFIFNEVLYCNCSNVTI